MTEKEWNALCDNSIIVDDGLKEFHINKPPLPRFKHNPIFSNEQRKEFRHFLDSTEPNLWFPHIMSDEQLDEARKALKKFFNKRSDFHNAIVDRHYPHIMITFGDRGDLNCKLCELRFLQLRDESGCLFNNEIVWKEAEGDETYGKYKLYEVHYEPDEQDDNVGYAYTTRIDFV